MAHPPILDDPNQSVRRAKTRIGVAVVLLAVAIGGLALLSRQKPETQTEEQPSQKQESISSGEHPAATVPAQQISSTQQEPPPPAAAETLPPPPPPPSVGALPPLNAPAPTAAPATKSSLTTAPASKPAEKPAASPPASKPAPAVQNPAPAPVQPAAPPTPPAKPEAAPRSYDVQVGVFTDMENAKQLQTKLAEHGIPSHTETKLQVGPFATKTEADAAKEKLKALGIGAVVVPGK